MVATSVEEEVKTVAMSFMRKLVRSSFAAWCVAFIAPDVLAAAEVDALLSRGESLRKKGDYVQAQKCIEEGIRILETGTPKQLARLSGAYNYLSLVENNAGKYSDAESDARKAIDFAKEAGLGADVIAMHQVVLANALRQECKFTEAQKLLEDALVVLDKPGINQQLLATAQNNLGAIYFWVGQYEKAMPLLRKGLETRRNVLDKNHADIANSYFDLGATEFKIGRTDDAVAHVSESLRIRQLRLGDHHPETLASEATLAVMDEAQGKTAEAEKLLAKVVANARQSLGPHHPDLAQYEDDYANVLASQKQFQKARAMQQDAMNIRKAVFGESSRDYAASLRSLAQIEAAAGEQQKAGELLKQSAITYKAAGQSADPDYADTLDDLGAFYVHAGNLESARSTFVESSSIRAQAGPTVAGAVSFANLSDVLARMNRLAESAEALHNAKKIIDALPESLRANPDCASILKRLDKKAGS